MQNVQSVCFGPLGHRPKYPTQFRACKRYSINSSIEQRSKGGSSKAYYPYTTFIKNPIVCRSLVPEENIEKGQSTHSNFSEQSNKESCSCDSSLSNCACLPAPRSKDQTNTSIESCPCNPYSSECKCQPDKRLEQQEKNHITDVPYPCNPELMEGMCISGGASKSDRKKTNKNKSQEICACDPYSDKCVCKGDKIQKNQKKEKEDKKSKKSEAICPCNPYSAECVCEYGSNQKSGKKSKADKKNKDEKKNKDKKKNKDDKKKKKLDVVCPCNPLSSDCICKYGKASKASKSKPEKKKGKKSESVTCPCNPYSSECTCEWGSGKKQKSEKKGKSEKKQKAEKKKKKSENLCPCNPNSSDCNCKLNSNKKQKKGKKPKESKDYATYPEQNYIQNAEETNCPYSNCGKNFNGFRYSPETAYFQADPTNCVQRRINSNDTFQERKVMSIRYSCTENSGPKSDAEAQTSRCEICKLCLKPKRPLGYPPQQEPTYMDSCSYGFQSGGGLIQDSPNSNSKNKTNVTKSKKCTRCSFKNWENSKGSTYAQLVKSSINRSAKSASICKKNCSYNRKVGGGRHERCCGGDYRLRGSLLDCRYRAMQYYYCGARRTDSNEQLENGKPKLCGVDAAENAVQGKEKETALKYEKSEVNADENNNEGIKTGWKLATDTQAELKAQTSLSTSHIILNNGSKFCQCPLDQLKPKEDDLEDTESSLDCILPKGAELKEQLSHFAMNEISHAESLLEQPPSSSNQNLGWPYKKNFLCFFRMGWMWRKP